MDTPKHKYHMLSDINEQPFPLNLLAEIGLSNQFSDAKQCTADIRKGLAAALSTLEEREELAILLRYRHGYKLDEIAEQLDVTRERARQVIRNALDKLNQPFARSLIECGIMGYIKNRAEAKADEFVRDRLSKEYLRGYETGRHDTAIAKESSVVFDFYDVDLSCFDTAAEFSVVGIESMRDLLYPVALSSIHEALREQVRHCYLSREAYREVIECLNENGFEIQPQDDIRPDIAYLPEFFSCPTIEYDEDDNPVFDKEHQLALNYASWMIPHYIEDMPFNVVHHSDDTQYIIEFGHCIIPNQQNYIDQYSIDSQKVVSFDKIYPYNLINAIFGKTEGVTRIFPEAEHFLLHIIEEAFDSLLPVESKALKLVFQCNIKAKDIIHFADIPANEVSDWWITEHFQCITNKVVRKLRHPRYSKKFRVFYLENPQKILEYIRQNSESMSTFSSPTPVQLITQCTDYSNRILHQNPIYTLNQIRDAYLQGKHIAYNGNDFQQRIWEIFPGDCIPFYLINDTILNGRTWVQWDVQGLYRMVLKSTVPELGSQDIVRGFFGVRTSSAYDHSNLNEIQICLQYDRIFLFETSTHEKQLYWWPRPNWDFFESAESIKLVPCNINSAVIENLYGEIIQNIFGGNSKDEHENIQERVNWILSEHYDNIPDSMIHDTILRTRQWCSWPETLVSKRLMEIPSTESVEQAFFGIGCGDYGEMLSGSAHRTTQKALLVKTSLQKIYLYWLLDDGSAHKFSIPDDFLLRLVRLVERGQELSTEDKTALQTALYDAENAFCNFHLNNQLPSNEVSLLKEFRHNLIYSMPIEKLDFTVRTYNGLKRAGIDTVGKLCEKSDEDLLHVKNLGKLSLDEIKRKLRELGLEIKGSSVDNYAQFGKDGLEAVAKKLAALGLYTESE